MINHIHVLLNTKNCLSNLLPVVRWLKQMTPHTVTASSCIPDFVEPLHREGIEVRLDSTLFQRFISENGGRLVLSATDYYHPAHSWARNLVEVARRQGVPSLSVQHGYYKPGQMLNPEMHFSSDRVAVWGDGARKILLGEIPALTGDRVVVTGRPFMDELLALHRSGGSNQENRLLLGLAQDESYTLLATQTHHLFEDIYRCDAEPVIAYHEALIRAIRRSHPSERLLIKPHPSEFVTYWDTHSMLQAAIDRSGQADVVLLDASVIDQLNYFPLLADARLVVSGFSNLCIDAQLAGTPGLYVTTPEMPYHGTFSFLVDGKGSRHVHAPLDRLEEELVSSLLGVATLKNGQSLFPEERIVQDFYLMDGKSAERVANEIDTLIQEYAAGWRPTISRDGLTTPPAMKPRTACSIVIPVADDLQKIERCLEKLIQHTPAHLFEVILVDNASSDGTAEFLQRLEGDVKVITNRERVGFAKACNQGAEAASGRYVLFLRSDAEPLSGWFLPLIKTMGENLDVAAVGGKLLSPDGLIQHAGMTIGDSISRPDHSLLSHRYAGLLYNDPTVNHREDVEAISSAALIIRTEAFAEVGGFDEALGCGYEDADLCFRLGEKGWRIVYEPQSCVILHESIDGTHEHRFQVTQSRMRFAQRWGIAQFSEAMSGRESRLDVSKTETAAASNRKRVSIIIPLYNQVAYTIHCLEALAENTPEELNYEVVLVDNASSDGTAEFLTQLGGDVVIQRNAENLGFAKACNQGARLASGEILLFLNNDTIPHPGWLEGLLNALDSEPRVGAVGNKLLFPDGSLQHAGVMFEENWAPAHWLYQLDAASHPLVNERRDFQCVTAACIAIPRDVFERVGGFDEGYRNGYEDVDLCLKIRREGYRIVYTPESVVTHVSSVSEGRKDFDDVNQRRLLTRWRDHILPDGRRFMAIAKGKEPRYSVLILTSGATPSLKACIGSVLQALGPQDEVIVLERDPDGSGTEIVRNVFAQDRRIHLVEASADPTEMAALHRGLCLAAGAYLVILQPDALVPEDGFERMRAHLSGEHVGAISPVSNQASGRQAVSNYLAGEPFADMGVSQLDAHLRTLAKGRLLASTLDAVCLLIPRQALEEAMLTSPSLLSSEAPDLVQMLKANGRSLLIAADVYVHRQRPARDGALPIETRAATLAEGPKPKILALVYGLDACPLIRLIGPLKEAERQGLLEHRVAVLSSGASTWDRVQPDIEWADIVIFQRFGSDSMLKVLTYCKSRGKRIVFEIDDDLLNLPASHPAHTWFQLPEIRESIETLAVEADLVTVSTGQLGKVLAPYNTNVRLLPNVLLDDVFAKVHDVAAAQQTERVVIGYAGTSTHQADLGPILPALMRLISEFPERVSLVFLGCHPPGFDGHPGVRFVPETSGYQDYAVELRRLGIQIGLAPLVDHSFNHAKSAIKWMEYAASGIVPVCSNVGPYHEVVEDGVSGVLVASLDPEQWYRALKRLLLEPETRARLATNAYETVRRAHMLQASASRWADAYRSLMNDDAKAASGPIVSIVIPLFNQVEYTRNCLEALIANTSEELDYEVILVDNASTDGTANLLAQLEGDVSIVRNPMNLGFAKACNQGARLAKGEYIVFLNNDTLPQAGWLDALIAEVKASSDVGIVGSKLLYPDSDTIQHAGIGWINGLPDHPYRHAPADAAEVNQARDLDMVTGACMLIRKAVFDAVSGFDEGYLNGVEDIDLCLQVRRAGYRVRYTPASVLYHFEGTSAGRFDHVSPNLARFFARWQGCFDAEGNFVPPAKPLPIRWEGSQFVYHSLAHVNREICRQLIATRMVDVEVVPYEPHQFDPDHIPSLRPIASRIGRKLPQPAAVHVRHQWPPSFEPPPEGAWVMIQPWEFGGIPEAWVTPMRDQVDEIWVPTSWVRDCYVRSGIPAEKVVVVPNGVDTGLYCPEGERYPLETRKTFKFLFVGGAIGRKGIDILLETYLATFTNQDDVCLVIKTNGANSHYRGAAFDEEIRRIAANPTAPEIELIDADLSDGEVAALYRACNALVHPYRGEGFGMPIAEAMASALPVIVTGYGACLDFCDSETAYLLPATEVRLENHSLPAPSVGYWWAEPEREALSRIMGTIVKNPAAAMRVGGRARERILAEYQWSHVGQRVVERLADLASRTPRRLANRDPFRPDTPPLHLQDRRGVAFFHHPDWASTTWQEVVTAYAHAFRAADDVSLVLWLDPTQGVGIEEASARLMDVLAEVGLDPEESPDLLLVPDVLDLAGLAGLYAAVDWVVAAGEAQQAVRAERVGRRVLENLAVESWREAWRSLDTGVKA